MREYRFKTEKEFIAEFGKNWYEQVRCTWAGGDMDYLFDTMVPSRAISELLLGGTGQVDHWQISWDMITELETSVKQIKINKNDYVGKINEVPRLTPEVRRGEKPRGSICFGRTKTVRIEVGYLSHQTVSAGC